MSNAIDSGNGQINHYQKLHTACAKPHRCNFDTKELKSFQMFIKGLSNELVLGIFNQHFQFIETPDWKLRYA